MYEIIWRILLLPAMFLILRVLSALRKVMKQLRDRGVKLYAAHLEGKKYYHQIDLKQASAFLIGNEGNGLKEETALAADVYMKIPMEGKVESLNAAVASVILMYEAARQRWECL